jgi:hypothetical protein
VLQCVAECCSILQGTCNVLFHSVLCACVSVCLAVCCSVLQCVAVCCSVLQCVAVYLRNGFVSRVLENAQNERNDLNQDRDKERPQHSAPPQCVAMCCNVLQGVAVQR